MSPWTIAWGIFLSGVLAGGVLAALMGIYPDRCCRHPRHRTAQVAEAMGRARKPAACVVRRVLRPVTRRNGYKFIHFEVSRGRRIKIPVGTQTRIVAAGPKPGGEDMRPRSIVVVSRRDPLSKRLYFYEPLPES